MRIGLLTDIHSHARELALAIHALEKLGAEKWILLGDTIDAFAPPAGGKEVCELLARLDWAGVWGNHDYSFCRETPSRLREKFPSPVFETMAKAQPTLFEGAYHFSHREASVDPLDPVQLWSISDSPVDLQQVARMAMGATDRRLLFQGHYHRWWAGNADGALTWSGEEPLEFGETGRLLVVVAAVCDGYCALLDTARSRVSPICFT